MATTRWPYVKRIRIRYRHEQRRISAISSGLTEMAAFTIWPISGAAWKASADAGVAADADDGSLSRRCRDEIDDIHFVESNGSLGSLRHVIDYRLVGRRAGILPTRLRWQSLGNAFDDRIMQCAVRYYGLRILGTRSQSAVSRDGRRSWRVSWRDEAISPASAPLTRESNQLDILMSRRIYVAHLAFLSREVMPKSPFHAARQQCHGDAMPKRRHDLRQPVDDARAHRVIIIALRQCSGRQRRGPVTKCAHHDKATICWQYAKRRFDYGRRRRSSMTYFPTHCASPRENEAISTMVGISMTSRVDGKAIYYCRIIFRLVTLLTRGIRCHRRYKCSSISM